MSITSPRLTASLCTLLLPMAACQELNPEFCVDHPVVTDNRKFTFSDIGPAAFAGTGNIAGDPQFVDSARGDFHLLATSPARDAADPAATLAVDLDDVPRPQGAGRDMGSYENR